MESKLIKKQYTFTGVGWVEERFTRELVVEVKATAEEHKRIEQDDEDAVSRVVNAAMEWESPGGGESLYELICDRDHSIKHNSDWEIWSYNDERKTIRKALDSQTDTHLYVTIDDELT